MTKVACVGECMIELREQADGLLSRSFGGDTLNTAVYLARLGVAVDYITALGVDPFSDAMLEAWREEGVGTQNVLHVPGRLPGLYLIQTDALGERRFSYWRDAAPVRQLFTLPDTPRLEAALPNYDVVYLSGITLSLFNTDGRQALFKLLDEARSKGGRVAFDTNFRSLNWPDRALAFSAYDSMLVRSDIVLASVEDYGLLVDRATERAADLMSAARCWLTGPQEREIVLRSSDLDCWVFYGERAVQVACPPAANVVDTTAAGDSFAAAYLAARLRGAPPEQAAGAGHQLAGLVIGHPGAIVPRDAMVLSTMLAIATSIMN